MIVWRVEDKDGRGPWQNGPWDTSGIAYQISGVDRNKYPHVMPSPDDDPKTGVLGKAPSMFGDHRYAYPSLVTLNKWWSPVWEKAEALGAMVVAVEVKDAKLLQNQVIYSPDTAVRLAIFPFAKVGKAIEKGAITYDDVVNLSK